MKNILNLKFKKFLLPLLSLSLICLIYIFYSSKNPPPKIAPPLQPSPTPTKQIHSDQPAFNQIKKYQVQFSPNINLGSFPSTLNLYSGSVINEDINAVLTDLIKKYNLSESSVSKNYWISNNKNCSLLINYPRQSFQLSCTGIKNLSKTKYNLKQAKIAATEFSSQFSFLKNLKIVDDKIEYFIIPANSEDDLLETSVVDKANLFNIPLSHQINSYPYYDGSFPNPQAQLMIGPNDTLFKLIYISQPLPVISNPQPLPLLSQENTKAKLESGQGEVISVNLMDLPYQATGVPLIILDALDIEYRYNNITQQVVPYFRFFGSYSSQYNSHSQIQIILPAVEI